MVKSLPEENKKYRGLTYKQMSFCCEYLVDNNATQAAIRAGYAADSAHVQGSVLLANPKLRKEIDRRMSRKIGRLDIQSDAILDEINKIANMKSAKTSDRLKALEMLAKHKKLITEKHEVDGQFVVKQMGRVVKDGKPIEFRVGNAI